MKQHLTNALCASALLLALGCGAQSASNDESAAQIAPESARLAAMAEQGEFIDVPESANKAVGWWQYISDGGTNLDVGAGDGDFCVVSEIAGKFSASDSDAAHMTLSLPEVTPQRWLFTVKNARSRVTCVPLASFKRPTGGVVWLSNEYRLTTGNSTTYKDTWWGDAATITQHVDGELDGDGESVRITQSANASTSSTLWVSNNKIAGSATKGVTRSLFVGIPDSGKLVSLIGYNDGYVRGNIKSSGTYTFNVSTTSGYSAFWMPDTETALCYFSRVQGQFDSTGDQLVIYKNGSQWYLRARSTSERGLSGAARCMAYDQR